MSACVWHQRLHVEYDCCRRVWKSACKRPGIYWAAPQRPQPRRPVHASTRRPLPPSALNQLSAVEACNEAAEATVTILEAAEATVTTTTSSTTTTTISNADADADAELPMSQHAAAASFQQMVEALSGAPTHVLLDAVGKLHAAALQRGVLLTPSDRVARRGRSAVNHNFMPRICS